MFETLVKNFVAFLPLCFVFVLTCSETINRRNSSTSRLATKSLALKSEAIHKFASWARTVEATGAAAEGIQMGRTSTLFFLYDHGERSRPAISHGKLRDFLSHSVHHLPFVFRN